MSKIIELPVERYLSLMRSEAELIELEAAGVDNWQGYDEVNWEAVNEQMKKLEETFND